MSDIHRAFVEPDGNFCIVTANDESIIRIVGAEEVHITTETAENAIKQLKENPDIVSINSDGELIQREEPIVKDSDDII